MTPHHCPACKSEDIYQDGLLWICPSCSQEWNPEEAQAKTEEPREDVIVVKDAHGKVLADGDSVSLIKELRINGSNSVIRAGTKVKNIKLIDAVDGHNIACRIDGLGALNLKSEFVKKA
jgi:protein PhnA